MPPACFPPRLNIKPKEQKSRGNAASRMRKAAGEPAAFLKELWGTGAYSMPSRMAVTKPKASMVTNFQLAAYPMGQLLVRAAHIRCRDAEHCRSLRFDLGGRQQNLLVRCSKNTC